MAKDWPKAEDGYLIDRVDYPRWLDHEIETDDWAHYDLTSEQGEWGAAIPLAFRLLVSPRAHLPYPVAPWRTRRPNESQAAALYWTPLLHLLLYSFGWSRPDLGMRWWVDSEMPVDDHRLRLIADLWQADGMLDAFLAWLWMTPHVPLQPHTYERFGHTPSRGRVRVDDDWVRAVEAETAYNRAADSDLWLHSRADPLHLSVHATGPLQGDPGPASLVRSDGSDHSAILMLDTMRGWYNALAEHGQRLPDIGSGSWYVDVVAKPVGHLGTFRRSRETGLWFSGPHSLHVRGV